MLRAQNILRDFETVDDLQCRGYYIIQKEKGFKFGMDAVLLADFATGAPGGRVMDLCSGTGVIPLLMHGRGKGAHFTGLEIQEEIADMAQRSVVLNRLEEQVEMVCGNLCDIVKGRRSGNGDADETGEADDAEKIARTIFERESFDAVTANPPYIKGGHGLTNAASTKMISRHEVYMTLEDLVAAAAYLLKPGGTFAVVYKPFRLAELITELAKARLEPKRMCLVEPHAGEEPNMVLLEAVKYGKPYLNCEPTLVCYGSDGKYTEELLSRYGGYY
ncbi:MAG: tRNA1(Val) (adenine(37)-N6)-methyltransferase [Lachnospiraceae bacterium]|nr:tRNA1(Val) (adenine(37)-N6)-methyltransferase [Lachnospiraceae bacterium]